MQNMTEWMIPGSGANPLIGNTDQPKGTPRACVLLLHGYMGYKDYGFIPVLGQRLADWGAIVHRFNFAYSGMTNDTATFARPDLFEQQTWNAQVYDTLCVLDALADSLLERGTGPLILIGHSRGGVASLLTVGRHHERPDIDGVVTLASPDACCSMDEPSQRAWLNTGTLDARSNRTGQTMPISSRWLEEQRADPAGHDLLHQASRVQVPLLAIHGDEDSTVQPASAERIASACQTGAARLIESGNHVFNMPNPPIKGGTFSPAFLAAATAIEGFLGEMTDNR